MLKQLHGLSAGIQALEAVGTVTADDYERIFAPLVDHAKRTGSRMRLLYQFGSVAWLTSIPESAQVSTRDIAKAYIGGVGAALGSFVCIVIPQRNTSGW